MPGCVFVIIVLFDVLLLRWFGDVADASYVYCSAIVCFIIFAICSIRRLPFHLRLFHFVMFIHCSCLQGCACFVCLPSVYAALLNVPIMVWP